MLAMIEVRSRPGEGDEDLAVAAIAEHRRVDRRRLRPAEQQPARQEGGDHEEQPADRVEMDDGIERQPAEHLGRPVPEPVRDEGVGELVDRERHEQEDRDQDDRAGVDGTGASGTVAGTR